MVNGKKKFLTVKEEKEKKEWDAEPDQDKIGVSGKMKKKINRLINKD